MAKMLARERAVQLGLAEARRGVREVGYNTGPRVRLYQAEDGYKPSPDTAYAWCASFVNAMFDWAGRPLDELKRSASVGYLAIYASDRGWTVSTPKRGDIFCMRKAPGAWPYHTGLVVDVLPDGTIVTVEGNTSDSSINEGDGVYIKRRTPAQMANATYIRVPGQVDAPARLVRWAIKDDPETIAKLKALRKKLNAK